MESPFMDNIQKFLRMAGIFGQSDQQPNLGNSNGLPPYVMNISSGSQDGPDPMQSMTTSTPYQPRTDMTDKYLGAMGDMPVRQEPGMLRKVMAGLAGFGEVALRTFESELKQAVIPFVEKNFRAKTDAADRALAGLSLGGLQTLYAGVRNTDMFSYLGVFSSGWFANNTTLSDPQYAFMKENAEKINHNLKSLWISMGGKEDIAYTNCQVMMQKFQSMGITYSYTEYPGGHQWPVWRNNLYKFAQILFR